MKTGISFISGLLLGASLCGLVLYFALIEPLQRERDRLKSEHGVMKEFMDLYGHSERLR